MIVKVKKDNVTKLKVAGNPIKISGFKDSIYRNDAPKINADRKKILKDFKIKDT